MISSRILERRSSVKRKVLVVVVDEFIFVFAFAFELFKDEKDDLESVSLKFVFVSVSNRLLVQFRPMLIGIVVRLCVLDARHLP